jgi:hypothetical protein
MNNHELIPTLIGFILLFVLIFNVAQANKAKNKEARRKMNNDRTIPDQWHEMNDKSYFNSKKI